MGLVIILYIVAVALFALMYHGITTDAEKKAAIFRDALKAIAEYGKRNPGHGYTCGKMATEALEKMLDAD